MSSANVRTLLSETLERMNDTGLFWGGDPLLRQVLKEIAGPKHLDRYVAVFQDYARGGIRFIDYWDEAYPNRLKHISTPPLLLFVHGRAFPGSAPVAIVGTRTPSLKGLKLAREFGSFFAERGHT